MHTTEPWQMGLQGTDSRRGAQGYSRRTHAASTEEGSEVAVVWKYRSLKFWFVTQVGKLNGGLPLTQSVEYTRNRMGKICAPSNLITC